MSNICKWRDNLHMNMIFSIWRFNFIAIWNLAGIYIYILTLLYFGGPGTQLKNTHWNSIFIIVAKVFSAADDTCYIHCRILQLGEIRLQQFQSQVHDQFVLLSSGK